LWGTCVQFFPQFEFSMCFRQTQGKCHLLWHNNSAHFTCRLFTKVAAFGIVLDDVLHWN
jgi:hypothetical protein